MRTKATSPAAAVAPAAAIRLSPTSYLVLGLIGLRGASTPYDLKRAVSRSVSYFWPFPHSQLYGEPERLDDVVVGAGLEPEHRVGVRIAPRQHEDRPLEAFRAQLLDRFAPVHVGQAHVHDDDVGRGFCDRPPRRRDAVGLRDRELCVKRQLLGKSLAQIGIIVDDEDVSRLSHGLRVSGK